MTRIHSLGLKQLETNDMASAVRGYLGSIDTDLGPHELSTRIVTIEAELEHMVGRAVVASLARTSQQFRLLNEVEFACDGRRYCLSTTRDALSPVLQVCVKENGRPSSASCWSSASIGGFGYFTAVELYVPPALAQYAAQLKEAAATVVRTAYCWIEEATLALCSRLERGLTERLYQQLRLYLEANNKGVLATHLWISVFSAEVGHYAIDRRSAEAILKDLGRRQYTSPHGPAYHLVKVLGLEMPYPQSFSRVAIAANSPMIFQLERAAYIYDKNDVLKTEEQMTLGSGYAIYPVAEVDGRTLVVSYPGALAAELVPVLDAHRDEFAAQYARHQGLLAQHVRSLRAYAPRTFAAWGQFLGAFFAELLKAAAG